MAKILITPRADRFIASCAGYTAEGDDYNTALGNLMMEIGWAGASIHVEAIEVTTEAGDDPLPLGCGALVARESPKITSPAILDALDNIR